MKFDLISLFPDFFNSPLNESLLAKAIQKDKLEVNTVNLRQFSTLPHHQTDDTPYGGGAGMVLKPDVLAAAVKATKTNDSRVVLMDPTGIRFDQKLAKELSQEKHLILIAGRYEGVDQRFKDKYVDQEISIGDYVLNGGEVAALVVLEAVARLLPGVLGAEASLDFESFSEASVHGKKQTLLEYPQYTKPVEFEGEKVPEILLSGNHKEIAAWRLDRALEKTKKLRPDLL